MTTKRVENSQQRLIEKLSDGKKYLEKEIYDIYELMRIKKIIEKKKSQFDKDIKDFKESTDQKDEEKIIELEEVQIKAKDLMDNLDHYISIEEHRKQQEERDREREMEEKRQEREAEEKRQEREAEEHEKEREYHLERERLELEKKKVTASMEEKINVEKIKCEKLKKETEEKLAILKEREKLTVKIPKLDLKKFNGNILKWTEFWDGFEAAIHNNKNLHAVDKLNYLKSQLTGNASEVLSGLELTNDIYKIAIDLLKSMINKML